MIVFVSGGCKNGKSYFAQRQAKNLAKMQQKKEEKNAKSTSSGLLYYIATMIPHDEEDIARIKRHLKEREGWGFETVEQGKNLMEILEKKEVDLGGTFLLDSVTAIMENEMYPVKLKSDKTVQFLGEDMTAPGRVKYHCLAFAKAVKECGGNVVFVSDEIYGDMGEYSDSTEKYRQALADVDRAISEMADKVYEVTYGQIEEWK